MRPTLADVSPENQTAANALFDAGKKLMEAGKYAEACPKFADSQKLDPGVGTLLNLARCYALIGRTASAWSLYRDAAAAARDKNQVEREKVARDEAAHLEPSLFKLVFNVTPQPGADAIVVKLDGSVLPPALLGMPTPVDPGDHEITASALNKKTWLGKLTVKGPAEPPFTIPVLEDAPADASSAGQSGIGGERHDGKSQRTLALVAGGVGVVGVGLGAAFGLMASSTNHQSDPYCNGDRCTAQGIDYRRSALDKATISTVAFTVGLVALSGGAALWFTAPKEVSSSVAITPAIGPDGAAFFVRGTW